MKTSALRSSSIEHRHMGQPLTRLLEAEVHADGDAAHAADLEVGDHKVGRRLLDRLPHALAHHQLTDLGIVVLESGTDLTEHARGIAHDEDLVHGAGGYLLSPSASFRPCP